MRAQTFEFTEDMKNKFKIAVWFVALLVFSGCRIPSSSELKELFISDPLNSEYILVIKKPDASYQADASKKRDLSLRAIRCKKNPTWKWTDIFSNDRIDIVEGRQKVGDDEEAVFATRMRTIQEACGSSLDSVDFSFSEFIGYVERENAQAIAAINQLIETNYQETQARINDLETHHGCDQPSDENLNLCRLVQQAIFLQKKIEDELLSRRLTEVAPQTAAEGADLHYTYVNLEISGNWLDRFFLSQKKSKVEAALIPASAHQKEYADRQAKVALDTTTALLRGLEQSNNDWIYDPLSQLRQIEEQNRLLASTLGACMKKWSQHQETYLRLIFESDKMERIDKSMETQIRRFADLRMFDLVSRLAPLIEGSQYDMDTANAVSPTQGSEEEVRQSFYCFLLFEKRMMEISVRSQVNLYQAAMNKRQIGNEEEFRKAFSAFRQNMMLFSSLKANQYEKINEKKPRTVEEIEGIRDIVTAEALNWNEILTSLDEFLAGSVQMVDVLTRIQPFFEEKLKERAGLNDGQ